MTRQDPSGREATGGAGGRLLVVSGPGGVGKGTVVAELARRRPDLVVSVSATTRAARPGEIDGRHYHFVSDETFSRLVAEDGFLEWAEYNGRRYGTPWTSIHEPLEAGRPVVLEIDVNGARQVRTVFPEATLVFLEPPSRAALEARLRGRGDDPAAVARRLAIAGWELDQADDFDHVVTNEDLDEAVRAIDRILGDAPA